MSLNIRLATRDDLPNLVELYADMDGKRPMSMEQAEKIFNAISTFPSYHVYLVFQNQKLVGTFSLIYVPTMMHSTYNKFAVLDALTVVSQLRGQGIGTQIVQIALQLSFEAGCYKVTLSSSMKRTGAHKFYQKLGFEQHGWSFLYMLDQNSSHLDVSTETSLPTEL